jgi:hypothetical protein
VKSAAWPHPTWEVPYPYGFASSLDGAGTVAAPLLAGFSISLIGLVVASPGKMRWPDEALVLLIATAVALIVAVQCAYSARQYVVPPEDLEFWWPDITNDERWKQVRKEQFGHQAFLNLWAKRFRRSFHGGLVLLLTALAVILFPPTMDSRGHQVATSSMRYVGIAIALLGALIELMWLWLNWLADRSVIWDETRRPGLLVRLADRLLPSQPERTPPDLLPSQAAESGVDFQPRPRELRPIEWWFTLQVASAVAVAMISVLFLVAVAFFVGWILGTES